MNDTSVFYEILTERLTGGVVFVIVLMVTGLIGNLHILFVYAFRLTLSNHRIFILFLGALDFLASIIAMPFTVITLRDPEMFTARPTCKLYWFVNYYICIASGLALLVIAIERYRKICVPLGWQLTRRLTVVFCVLVIVISTVCSWPVLILMGTTTTPTDTPKITDSICATEDKENYSTYQIYYHIFLSILVLPSFIALIVLYTCIWRVVRRYAMVKRSMSNYQSYVKDDSTSTNPLVEIQRKLSVRDQQNIPFDSQKNQGSISGEQNADRSRHSDRTRKTTLAFILITVIFFISYIPYLLITILIYTNSITVLTPGEVVFINIIRYTPYINNMANVFVYGCFDLHFRREVGKFDIYKLCLS